MCLQSKCDGYADAQMNGYTQTLLGPSIMLQWTLKLKHLKIQKYLTFKTVLLSIPYPYGIAINIISLWYNHQYLLKTLYNQSINQYLILMILPPIPYPYDIATNTLSL